VVIDRPHSFRDLKVVIDSGEADGVALIPEDIRRVTRAAEIANPAL
jgi:hypothetical protein